MAYASGAAHYHLLLAVRSLFQPLVCKLISEILRREVWVLQVRDQPVRPRRQSRSYGPQDAMGGPRLQRDYYHMLVFVVIQRVVVAEQLKYPGHLLLMVSLFSMLFNDDSFDRPDSLVLDWDPLFFGLNPERSEYDRCKLQGTILKEMER
ncbi:hypothetical protein B0A55_13741 [Friedmanniomyces simplex]|uniref:Linalool dehydratase/isomerase domain-containing protein n=1 Tax=Friedmanniomyces simplex TaxID=329884 RepID=A0A4U0WF74_9PEZI|nr:hypothetical protein B0A55_13741 [Friedmanniomyces simplex]